MLLKCLQLLLIDFFLPWYSKVQEMDTHSSLKVFKRETHVYNKKILERTFFIDFKQVNKIFIIC